ncbi:hypothetical protein ACFQ0M_35490 [Kitasatospora aburaviensis]
MIGRLERAARPELHLLAIGTLPAEPAPSDVQSAEPTPTEPTPAGPTPAEPALALAATRSGRVNLGLERLQTADLVLPALRADALRADALRADAPRADALTPSAAPDLPGTAGTSEAPEAPVHLLTRRVEQAVTGGRQALGLGAGTADGDATRLRSAGLATGAVLLDALRASAADQPRDVFGRVVADDHEAFTAAWLAAACYGEELATALCAAAWAAGEETWS